MIVTDEADLAAIARSVRVAAVVGMRDASRADAPAYEIPHALQRRGIRVIPVNPTIAESLGERAYAKVADVPDRFDLLLVFRRSDAIGPVADDVLALPPDRRPDVVWLQSGIRNDEAAARLATAGVRVVQDRCLSVYTARYRR